MGLLDQIESPRDLKKLDEKSLPLLAQEIRTRIIEVVSRNGGHLSSNLGVVEMSIALHRVFDAPRDKIIWDTGHQGYTHKLLTGRIREFDTLRQSGGISGFLRRAESPFDHFGAGHEGTGLSAALGMLEARDHHSEDGKVVVIIGDATLTAGLALEALNNAGHLKKDLIVILNDNKMSISKNVGAISAYLSRIISGQWYTRLKRETKRLLSGLPKIGGPVLLVAKRVEEMLKGLVGPGIFFEELGFTYVGPIDGHRFDHLLPTLENVKAMKGPVIVHLITKKGLGYPSAEKDPISFHSAPPFDVKTGKPKKWAAALTYTNVFTRTLRALARRDPRIVAITAAMPEGTGLGEFAREFPNRFYDVGIAEQHAVAFAAGLAAAGMRPVVAIYSTFLQRAYDQIIHDVALQNLPVVLCLDRAGIVGEDGHTHHGIFDIAYLRLIPNMAVMSPKDENELQHMLSSALTYPGPIAIRYPRGEGVGVPLDPEFSQIPLGRAEMIVAGKDVAMVALGSMVHPAMTAATRLAEEGISAAVVNARFAKPIDREMALQLAKNFRRIVTIEEGVACGGFGSAFWETLEAEGQGNCEIRRIALPDDFIEHGNAALLRSRYGLSAEGIARRVAEFLEREIVSWAQK